eukprot:5187429-Karenia_brevis.AAC.1
MHAVRVYNEAVSDVLTAQSNALECVAHTSMCCFQMASRTHDELTTSLLEKQIRLCIHMCPA